MSEGRDRESIQRIREDNRRIADLIMQGTAKHEPVKVMGLDDREQTFEVFPVSDGDFADLLATTGFNPKDLGDKEKLGSNYAFLTKGAALVTGVPDISRALKPMESMKLLLKSFELSGVSGPPKEASPRSSTQQNPRGSKS